MIFLEFFLILKRIGSIDLFWRCSAELDEKEQGGDGSLYTAPQVDKIYHLHLSISHISTKNSIFRYFVLEQSQLDEEKEKDDLLDNMQSQDIFYIYIY